MLIPRGGLKAWRYQASATSGSLLLCCTKCDPSSTVATSENTPLPSSLFVSLSPKDHYDAVLSHQDLIVGAFLAVSLAFLISFLQSSSSSVFPSIILWPKTTAKINNNYNNTDQTPMDTLQRSEFVFDEWDEISRPENYILYTTKIRKTSVVLQNNDGTKESSSVNMASKEKENRLVVVALLVLFIPIFSVEFFFALSRQIVCGNYVFDPDDATILNNPYMTYELSPWATALCSPHTEY